MRKRLGTILLPALLYITSGAGCSENKHDKPIPEIPKGGLKGIKINGSVAPKPLPPPS
jgi:hypothetical protein